MAAIVDFDAYRRRRTRAGWATLTRRAGFGVDTGRGGERDAPHCVNCGRPIADAGPLAVVHDPAKLRAAGLCAACYLPF